MLAQAVKSRGPQREAVESLPHVSAQGAAQGRLWDVHVLARWPEVKYNWGPGVIYTVLLLTLPQLLEHVGAHGGAQGSLTGWVAGGQVRVWVGEGGDGKLVGGCQGRWVCRVGGGAVWDCWMGMLVS